MDIHLLYYTQTWQEVFLKVYIFNAGSKITSVIYFVLCYIEIHANLAYFVFWIDLLSVHDFVTTYVGQLESISSLSYEYLPNAHII